MTTQFMCALAVVLSLASCAIDPIVEAMQASHSRVETHK